MRMKSDDAATKRAINRIDKALREDNTGYSFSDLRDRFESAYEEAIVDGEDSVVIKIPSGSEWYAGLAIVGLALGR